MLELSEASTSKAARINSSASNDNEMEELDDNEDISSSLWCIEDDSMFYAQGLKHHSAGKGKSVYITWNENYLLNFVFKTSSKTGATTLTKVRIPMPVHKEELEEIENMLILEMNTLLYMKSGNVYYFSSVKSMHKVEWLTAVRCMASCPPALFSVIRLVQDLETDVSKSRKILSLEVYKDEPLLGKLTNGQPILCHSYDITFDLENIFNCNWLDETYTITSLITNETNIEFLEQLVTIGDILRPPEERVELDVNQEIHIFTISGNLLALVGAPALAIDDESSNPEVDDYTIRLINTYACHIECIRIDCESNLLIVLLKSGQMDIWYKNTRVFGALFHQQHQMSDYLCYDYCTTEKIFYFTTPEDVVQLKIITSCSEYIEKECMVKETRKSIGGMIACTWVENLKQLICLSFNNVFYRIHFTNPTKTPLPSIIKEAKYEHLNNVYALNSKRVRNLTAKAQLVNELVKQPKQIYHDIEKEFQKQQVLALASKREILKKLFQCHQEYHVNIPSMEYFDKDCVLIRPTTNNFKQPHGSQSVYNLIFLSLNNKSNFLTSVFAATMWYLNIANTQQNIQLHVPYELLLNKQLCIILEICLKQNVNMSLPNYNLNLLSFLKHNFQYICLNFKLSLAINEKTYLNIFSHSVRNLDIFRNSVNDIETLLQRQIKQNANKNIEAMDCTENCYKLKHRYKISKKLLQNILEKLKAKLWSSLEVDFEIYFLHQYLIILNYEDSEEILEITSNYPIAIFYIKLLLLLHALNYNNDLDIVDGDSNKMQQKIMNYQNDIEHLYGSLNSLEGDVNSNTCSMHFENMQNIYLKLRHEFYNILR